MASRQLRKHLLCGASTAARSPAQLHQALRQTLLLLKGVGLVLTLACFGCLLISPERSYGNDTEAELAIGGLVLIKSANIDMRSEKLYVSSREINVEY